MTDKARELLERAFDVLVTSSEAEDMAAYKLEEEIRTYLAEPEVNQEVLNGNQILEGWIELGLFSMEDFRFRCFTEGVRFAEKHHGIGGGDE